MTSTPLARHVLALAAALGLPQLAAAQIGPTVCHSNDTSLGVEAILYGNGPASLMNDDLILHATPAPISGAMGEPGIFAFAAEAYPNPAPPLSAGRLCLKGQQYRMTPPVTYVGELGPPYDNSLAVQVDYSSYPELQVGTTWIFQAYFRDQAGALCAPPAGVYCFNLSSARRITFQL